MKKILVLLMFLFVLLSHISCCKQEVSKMPTADTFMPEFDHDNTISLSALLNNKYSLEELYDFFGKIPLAERCMYNKEDDVARLTYEEVNARFPIECIRKGKLLFYYSVYMVDEGGYFYVFWSAPMGTFEDDLMPNNSATVTFTTYLSELRAYSDFQEIKRNVSTAENVARLDPAVEVIFTASSGVCSYNLLKDGQVLEIQYKTCDSVQSRDSLVVDKLEIMPNTTALYTSYLAQIWDGDLP